MVTEILHEKINDLTPAQKMETLFFIELLNNKENKAKTRKSFTFDWEGGLKDMRDEFTSIELQHKSLEWW